MAHGTSRVGSRFLNARFTEKTAVSVVTEAGNSVRHIVCALHSTRMKMHGSLTVYVLIIHCPCMDHEWMMSGLCMDYVLIECEFGLDYV